jgi:hypothetical protein
VAAVESAKSPSIERGSVWPLDNQEKTEGAPGSSFEPGSWVLGLPRASTYANVHLRKGPHDHPERSRLQRR